MPRESLRRRRSKSIAKVDVQIESLKPLNDEELFETVKNAAKSRSTEKLLLKTSSCTYSGTMKILNAFEEPKYDSIVEKVFEY